MATRIEDNEPAVLPRDNPEELPRTAVVGPPPSVVADYEEWLAQLPPYRRTFREKVVHGLRRAWYGPDPGPLTDAEMAMIMRLREEDDDLPERVPPDDPGRLAQEAELRAIGVTPARKWSFPDREPVRRLGVWGRIKYRISLGW